MTTRHASAFVLLLTAACSDAPVASVDVEAVPQLDLVAAPSLCGASPSDYGQVVTVNEPSFDTELFADIVTTGLAERFMGYAFILLNAQGERVVRGEYGLARTACEPEGLQKFTIRTKTNWGSVAKMLTFTAAMHRIENPAGAGAWVPDLDAHIEDFLPERWGPAPPPPPGELGLSDVQVWHLLEHRAGFKKTAPPPMWERLLSLPETDEGIGVRKYSNTSASSFQAMPYFFDPAAAEAAENVYGYLDYETYSEIMYYVGVYFYHEYVQDQLLAPLGISAQCNISEFPDGNWSKYYSGPTDQLGSMVNDTLWDSGCAAGGWMLSPLSMGKFAHALSQTETLISSETYDLMANTDDPDHRKGWQGHQELADGHLFSHNGIRWNGKAKGQMTVFPNGFVAVGAINSKSGSSGPGIGDLFVDAYEAAR